VLGRDLDCSCLVESFGEVQKDLDFGMNVVVVVAVVVVVVVVKSAVDNTVGTVLDCMSCQIAPLLHYTLGAGLTRYLGCWG